MSDWTQEITEIRTQRAAIQTEIDRLHEEDNQLGLRERELRNHELQRDYGLNYGDKLAVTSEFVTMLRGRSGWDEYVFQIYFNPSYLAIDSYYGEFVSVKAGDTGSNTGNVPLDMAQRMRKAWLDREKVS